MQQSFTKQFMIDNFGGYSNTPGRLEECSFMQSDIITLQSILESEISLKDKYLFVCKKLATKEQNQEIAIGVAEIVLPIFEKRYPNNKAPRECIEAAKQYIAGYISLEVLVEKRRAADAAYAAAYAAADATADADAAYATYAAAYAACAAADAADTAADTVYAADAAAAYADAAAAADIKEQLETYLLTFCQNA